MEATVIREEVQAFMQACQSLTGFALYNRLTSAERDAIASLAHDLETQFGPSHQPRNAPTDPLLARLHEATFSADWEVS